LFIGDVGRPDLAQKGKELTMADLATHLFNSLRNKIMTLPGELIVYPGHGAGSACGKKMSNETQDTLANQIATNYALRTDMTVDEFVNEVTHGLVAPPAYFPLNVKMNKEGYSDIHQVISNGTQALSPNAFELVAEETGALILDTRNPEVFVKGFIPNSINIGLDGSFAPWVGALIPDIKQQILLVCEEGREEEAVIRLARVGYDFTIGFLEGGINAWKAAGKELDTIESISAETFAEAFNTSEVSVLDVRKSSENFSERIPSAENTPLDFINDHLASIKPDHTYYVHCAGGYRSVVFISILQARGYRNLINVEGGFKAIKATEKVTITDYVCPSTEL
jgi:rhodanese-related sulfurtransferase